MALGDKTDPVSNLGRTGKITPFHVCIPLYLREGPGLFSDRSFHMEAASVHTDKMRCVKRSWEVSSIAHWKGLQVEVRAPHPSASKQISKSLPAFCHRPHFWQELTFIVFCFLRCLSSS